MFYKKLDKYFAVVKVENKFVVAHVTTKQHVIFKNKVEEDFLFTKYSKSCYDSYSFVTNFKLKSSDKAYKYDTHEEAAKIAKECVERYLKKSKVSPTIVSEHY